MPSTWQPALRRLERMTFIHFGVNTFTGREWSMGTEGPNVLQLTA